MLPYAGIAQIAAKSYSLLPGLPCWALAQVLLWEGLFEAGTELQHAALALGTSTWLRICRRCKSQRKIIAGHAKECMNAHIPEKTGYGPLAHSIEDAADNEQRRVVD